VQGRCGRDEVHLRNWIMENCYMRNSGRWPDCKNGLGLRDVDTLAYYPSTGRTCSPARAGFVKSFLFPGPAGEYSCVALKRAARLPIFG